MSDQRQPESSVLISLAELRTIEQDRVSCEVAAEQSAREQAERARRAAARARERQAAEQAKHEAQAERVARQALAQAEADARAAQLERERRSRVEAELVLAQARVEAARNARGKSGGSARSMFAIVAVSVLVVGALMAYAVHSQSQRRAAAEAELARNSARTESIISGMRTQGARNRTRIANLNDEIGKLRDRATAPVVRVAAASSGSQPSRSGSGKSKSRGRPKHKKPRPPLVRTQCPDNDPLCGIDPGRKLFAR